MLTLSSKYEQIGKNSRKDYLYQIYTFLWLQLENESVHPLALACAPGTKTLKTNNKGDK